MQNSEPLFRRQNLTSVLVYAAINMVIASIFNFAFSYNIYIPMMAVHLAVSVEVNFLVIKKVKSSSLFFLRGFYYFR